MTVFYNFSSHNLYDLVLTYSGPQTVRYPPPRSLPSPSWLSYSFQNKLEPSPSQEDSQPAGKIILNIGSQFKAITQYISPRKIPLTLLSILGRAVRLRHHGGRHPVHLRGRHYQKGGAQFKVRSWIFADTIPKHIMPNVITSRLSNTL